MNRWIAALLAGILFIPHVLNAQSNIALGTWRTHFSYQNARLLALADNQAYVATQNGLFSYHFTDNTLSVLSKLDGLSDAGISAMAFQEELGLLMIAYRSGMVDVLSNGSIGTFDLLAEAESREQINGITFANNTAYLATSEGVRVLSIDTDRLEINIKESYTRLSAEGAPLAIYDVAISSDSIFLASEEGVIANTLASNVNRQDFRSWKRFGTTTGIAPGSVFNLAQQGEIIYAAVDGTGVFARENGEWYLTALQASENFSSLWVSERAIVASLEEEVWVLSESLQMYEFSAPYDVALSPDGTLWVADGTDGLVKISNGQRDSFFPNGPINDDIYSIHFAEEKLISLQAEQAAFSVFDEGRWTNYSLTFLEEAVGDSDLSPLIDADFFAADNHYYFGSTGSGLLRWDGNEIFSLITVGENNSLVNNQISALETNEQQLWVTNFATTNYLQLFDANSNTWQTFSPTATGGNFPFNLSLVNGTPWILTGQGNISSRTGSNLLVYDPVIDESLLVRSVVASGSLPGSTFTELVEDRDGQAWLSGSDGISYFPTPFDVFSSPTVIKPVFENQFLLFGDYVTALAIDGGNRKWVGSRDGIWLFEETGEALVSHFTTENSPVPSDNILDIAIDDRSGEVFILTDQGLVSYRGTASQGQVTHNSVKIFPNPVQPGFDGLVGMEGLVTDAIIKITTISGTLVQQLQAEGGTAVWNLQDYSGSKVASGIYLVFSASADGSETFVGKIAVIN